MQGARAWMVGTVVAVVGVVGVALPATRAGAGPAAGSATGTVATQTALSGITLVKVDSRGNLVISDSAGTQVVADSTGVFYGLHMKSGDIYTVTTAVAATVDTAVDRWGNQVIVKEPNEYKAGHVAILAEATGYFYGEAMTKGSTYTLGTIPAFGLGGFATRGIRFDADGDVIVFLGFQGSNYSYFTGLYVLPSATRTLYGLSMQAGQIYTLAPGDTGNHLLATITSLQVDQFGNLLFTDFDAGAVGDVSSVQVIAALSGTFYGQAMSAGALSTVAGAGFGVNSDGGPATSAYIDYATNVVVDPLGNLVIGDEASNTPSDPPGTNQVQVIAESTGMMYGQQMTEGDIYDVAGVQP